MPAKQGLPRDASGEFEIPALNIEYDDAILPALGADNVQDAIDKLKVVGASETFAKTYAAGTTALDQTPLIDPANGGPVTFKGNLPGVGSLIKAIDSALNTLLDINDGAAQILRSAFADGPARAMFILDTLFPILDPTAFLLDIRNANSSKWRITSEGAAEFFDSVAATASAGRQRFNSVKMQVCNNGTDWVDQLVAPPASAGFAVTGAGGTIVVANANVKAGTNFILTIDDGGIAPTNGVYISARTVGVDFTIQAINPLDVGVQIFYQLLDT